MQSGVDQSWRQMAALVMLLCASLTQAADFKLAGSCMVLDYDVNFPQDQRTSTSYSWSGGCDVAGFATGRGELRAFWNGRVDEDTVGTLISGRLEGMATTNSASGYQYQGMYQGGVREGQGVLSRAASSGPAYRYAGAFHAGVPSGHGVLDVANGRHYEGEFRQGVPNGRGIETGVRGLGEHYRYVGDFVNDRWTGHGSLSWSRGDRYEGGFRDGMCDGRGVWVWPDGKRYDGWFARGMPSGWGRLTYADGTYFMGQFFDGKAVARMPDTAAGIGLPMLAGRP